MMYESTTELYHYGIKGQKWGIRRYQNEDGTLTEEGKKKYYTTSTGVIEKKPSNRKLVKEYNKEYKTYYKKERESKYEELTNKYNNIIEKYPELDRDDTWNAISESYGKRKEQLKKAEKEIYNIENDLINVSKEASNNGKKYADKYISNKYGGNTVKQIENYKKSVGIGKVITLGISGMALVGGAILYLENK